MKKFLLLIFCSVLGIWLGNSALAACKQVEFANGRICVDIIKKNNSTFEIKTNIQEGNGTLRCGIVLENNVQKDTNCNEEFFVGNTKEQYIKIYPKLGSQFPIDREGKPNNKSERAFPQWMYDFGIGNRSNWLYNNDQTTNNFQVTTDNSNPNTNERVDLSIKAMNNNNTTNTSYRGTVQFEVYYRLSSSDSRRTAYSNDFEFRSYYNDEYSFRSSDNGYVTLTDYITFKKAYDFKVKVIDTNNNIYWEKIFYLNENSNNTNINNFQISSNTSNLDTYDRTDITIRARDNNNYTATNYRGTIQFEVYYRLSSSDSRRYTSSSSLFEIDSYYKDGYTFRSSDNGQITLNNFFRAKRNYDFKIKVIDKYNSYIYWEKVFYTDSSTNDTENFLITANNSTPNTNQRINLYIKARDNNNYTITDYRGSIDFEVYYRLSSSDSRKYTSSSSFFEIDSYYKYWYTFSTLDRGDAILNNIIRFKKQYDYKIKVIDKNNSYAIGEKIFYIGNWNQSSIDGFSSQEISNVQKIYNIRDLYIQSIKNTSSRLKNNQTRITMSNELKNEMKNILNNTSYKKYENYQEFNSGFSSRYSYTIRNK